MLYVVTCEVNKEKFGAKAAANLFFFVRKLFHVSSTGVDEGESRLKDHLNLEVYDFKQNFFFVVSFWIPIEALSKQNFVFSGTEQYAICEALKISF